MAEPEAWAVLNPGWTSAISLTDAAYTFGKGASASVQITTVDASAPLRGGVTAAKLNLLADVHARIVRSGPDGEPVLYASSPLGVWLNGAKIHEGNFHALRSGDEICLVQDDGDLECRFCMSSETPIDGKKCYERLQKLNDAWTKSRDGSVWSSADALAIVIGSSRRARDDQPNSWMLHLWLFGEVLHNSILLFCERCVKLLVRRGVGALA